LRANQLILDDLEQGRSVRDVYLRVLLPQLETLRESIEAVRKCERGDRVKILVGGFALASAAGIPEELGSDGYAADPDAAVEQGRQLVGLPPRGE